MRRISRERSSAGLRAGARWVLDTLLPPGCPGCGEELAAHRWICLTCRRRLRAVPAQELCISCRSEMRPGVGREAGLGCRVAAHDGWRGGAAWWMEPPLDAVIHRFKYGGVPTLAEPLARLLAGRVPPPPAWGIASVPLHVVRRRERGYDQAELLARALGTRWGLPYVPELLTRRRATRAQAKLSEARRGENVRGAFRVKHPSWVRGRVWVLIDDVVTTGETLGAASEVLRATGALGVVPVALALA